MMTINLRRTILALATVLLSFQGAAMGQSPNIVTDITISPSTPNIVKFGETVWVSFNYDTTEMVGVRIWARPVTIDPETGSDMPTPNYGACGSPLYMTGSGTGYSCFTISSGGGPVVVDKIRFQMWDANGTTLLFSAKVPVNIKVR